MVLKELNNNMNLVMSDVYQTVPLPNNTVLSGLFPTIDWFNTINRYISFRDKTVLDLGCCEFSYGVQALVHKAEHVTGIDNDLKRIDQSKQVIDAWSFGNQTKLIHSDIETWQPDKHYDITIFSMIIHWLKDPAMHIIRLFNIMDTAILIYRLPEKDMPGYRPSIVELSTLLGREPMIQKVLMDTPTQHIGLVIYDKKDI